MQCAPLPENEEQRLKKLYDLEILDTGEEQAFDDLTYLAAQVCEVPIAMISLIDHDDQFLKSRHGMEVNRISRELGFCPHAILDDELMIVEDTAKDDRFFDNPYVTGEPHIQFYAGAPLIFPNNIRLGTICVVDQKPRTLTAGQEQALSALARQVVLQLEQRMLGKELDISDIRHVTVQHRLHQFEARERARNDILDMLAKGTSLDKVLEAIVVSIETELKGTTCAILLVDEQGEHLLHGAGAGLPQFYIDAVHGLAIGPGIGSCGTAAHSGQRVLVDDVQCHPYWAPYKEITKKAGLTSCWSEPIFNVDGGILGTFSIYNSSQPIPDKNELAIIEYAANLAGVAIQYKRKEQLVLATKAAAESASRAKSEFLSTMSHELRTPLTSIQGALGLLLGKATGELPAKSVEVLEVAARNSRRLMRLINDMLDLNKIEAGKMEFQLREYSLKSLLQQAIESNTAYAQRFGIQLDLCLPEQEPMAWVDSDRFAQVMANLISNAVKFSQKGDTVEISLLCDKLHARVSVRDHGPGIDEAFHEKIFDKFTQQDSTDSRRRGGTGLGLAISKRLVENMHGDIGFYTTPGEGSEFYFDLPMAVEPRNDMELEEKNHDDQTMI